MKSRLPYESAYIYVLLALVSFLVADLVVLSFRDEMLPTQSPPLRSRPIRQATGPRHDNYGLIVTKNIFNSDGKVPPPIGSNGEINQFTDEPQPTSLTSIELVGTIVHVNPLRSVATLRVKSRNDVLSYSPDENIENIASLTKVERGKITFRNLQNQRLEYLEMPKDQKISFGVSKGKSGGEVEQTRENEFSIRRDDVLKYTSDLPRLLQQARAIPRKDNLGNIMGFQLVDIQPDSIYERLGLRPGDMIKGVNGQPVDSPAKAMELYNALKDSASIALEVERNGRTDTFNYNIR